jgi:histidine triad (HIT) family protein
MDRSGSSGRPEAGCTFCKIVRGELEGWIVLEDEVSAAFLDRRPLFPGHCLLVPRAHHETLLDLPAELVPPLFANAQRLARALEVGLDAQGSFVAINNRVSQSVPHLHVHVVPRRFGDRLRGFFWPRARYRSAEHMRSVRDAIRTALNQIPQD